MIQRIATRLLLEHGGKPLLLRRADGRSSILGKYELPGGRIFEKEQPEEALQRYLVDDLGLGVVPKVELVDVFTYHDADDRDIQYAIILYRAAVDDINRAIKLGSHYDKYVWYTSQKLKAAELTDLTQFVLEVQSPELFHPGRMRLPVIYTDGGSRGNPGLSAAGFVLVDREGMVVDQGSKFLGVSTNEVAEYEGVKLGLSTALKKGWKQAECRVDSMLVVNQINGIYKIKNDDLWPLYQDVQYLVQQFDRVKFVHISRELNQLADGLVNKRLDEELSK